MTPDISAVADPYTGVKIVVDKEVVVGGGTSQAAPIWAGLTAIMNQHLTANGGRPIGALNPLLYRIATGQDLQAPRTWQLGNASINRLLWTGGNGLTLVGWADEQHLDSALDESSA